MHFHERFAENVAHNAANGAIGGKRSGMARNGARKPCSFQALIGSMPRSREPLMPDHRTITTRSKTNRSRVTNGSVLVQGVDGRTRAGRRMHDVIAALTIDLGGDLAEAERLQVRSIAALTVRSEQLAADLLNGRQVDSEQLTRCANSAARLLAALRRGRQRKSAKPAPSLSDYIAAKRQAEATPA